MFAQAPVFHAGDGDGDGDGDCPDTWGGVQSTDEVVDFLGRLHHVDPAHLEHCDDEDYHHCGDDDDYNHCDDDDDENDDQYYRNYDQLINLLAGATMST